MPRTLRVEIALPLEKTPYALDTLYATLAPQGKFTFVDPYTGVSQIRALITRTECRKILRITPRSSEREGTPLTEKDEIQLAVDDLHNRGFTDIDVRTVPSKRLHDRYVIPDSRAACLALGTSLTSIGKVPSILVTLNKDLSAFVRDTHRVIWDAATKIVPTSLQA